MASYPPKFYLEDDFKEFFGFLREGKVCICYSPIFREFTIQLKSGSAVQQLAYCPWSGKKFPHDLRKQYFETLTHEFNFNEPTIDDILERRVPLEMQTEEWWIKRDL